MTLVPIWLSAGGATFPTTTPASKETQDEYDVLKFAVTGINIANWSVGMPNNWNAGTIAATFYYLTTATDTNKTIGWQIAGNSIGDEENTDQAFPATQIVAGTVSGTASYLKKASISTRFQPGGVSPAAGELLHLMVKRDPDDASDTTSLDAYLIGVLLQFGVTSFI